MFKKKRKDVSPFGTWTAGKLEEADEYWSKPGQIDIKRDDEIIATVWGTKKNCNAIAQIISAAPDMLKALDGLCLRCIYNCREIRRQERCERCEIYKAIKKACDFDAQ